MVDFKATTQGGKGTLAVFFSDGDSKTLQSTHPTYTETLTYLVATPVAEHDEDYVRELVNPALRLGRALKAVDDKFEFDMFTLSYDGFPMSGPLADLIKDRLSNGHADWERFVRFAARLEANPSFGAKQGLYSWVTRNGLHILSDGRFVAHKAISRDGLSQSSGPNNFINGVLLGKPGVSVRVPHAVGTVVSKRRQDVDDSSVACATGLHIGTHEYASDFAPIMVTVAVGPEDVVGGDQHFKIRVARYEVLGLNEDKVDFVGEDYEIVDRSNVLSDGEKAFAVGAPLLSREAEFESDEDRAEFNSLSSAGRNLYLNLRNLLAKSHTIAFEAALADHGTWEDFLAKQEAERAEAEQARIEEEQEAAQAAAETAHDEAMDAEETAPVEVQTTEDIVTDVLDLSSLSTMDEKAQASTDLRRDLANTSLGHKPLARKWESAGVTESSVRRYRKAHDISVTFGTRVRDALS